MCGVRIVTLSGLNRRAVIDRAQPARLPSLGGAAPPGGVPWEHEEQWTEVIAGRPVCFVATGLGPGQPALSLLAPSSELIAIAHCHPHWEGM